MFEVPLEKLIDKMGNKYLLSLASARRAQQLREGSYPLVEGAGTDDPLSLVMQEILAGKIKVEMKAPEKKTTSLLEDHFPLSKPKAEEPASIRKEAKPKKKKSDKKKKAKK